MASHNFEPLALHDGVVRAAPSTNRAPSPPSIHIPTPLNNSRFESVYTITPLYDSVSMSADDVKLITGGRDQHASTTVSNHTWRYEHRRKAQPVLDFLYLGPMSAARDRDWLQEEGITMLLGARDASMAAVQLMAVEKRAQGLGVEAAYVDTASRQELIRSFGGAVDKINDHMLRVHRAQEGATEPRRGKVLVFCETGNERSAAVVAAYVMTMYGRDMVQAVQFVSAQRFCTNFDEPTKYLLQTYGDLLQARRMTAMAGPAQDLSSRTLSVGQQEAFAPGTPGAGPALSRKRNFTDTMDEDEGGNLSMDMERYEGRSPFAPFVDGAAGTKMDDS